MSRRFSAWVSVWLGARDMAPKVGHSRSEFSLRDHLLPPSQLCWTTAHKNTRTSIISRPIYVASAFERTASQPAPLLRILDSS